jgi:hypothetical protein
MGKISVNTVNAQQLILIPYSKALLNNSSFAQVISKFPGYYATKR